MRALLSAGEIGRTGGPFPDFIERVEKLGEEDVKGESWSVIVGAVGVSGLKVSQN